MGRKKVIFTSESIMSKTEAAAYLRQLADKLEQGQIILERGKKKVDLRVPGKLELEIEVEEKYKDDRVKKELEIELEWYDDESSGESLQIK